MLIILLGKDNKSPDLFKIIDVGAILIATNIFL